MTRRAIIRVDRIAMQIAIVILTAVMLVHLIGAAAFYAMRNRLEPRDGYFHDAAAFARLVDATAIERRPVLLADLTRVIPQMGLRAASARQTAEVRWDDVGIAPPPVLSDSNIVRGKLMAQPEDKADFHMAFRLADGTVLLANLPQHPPRVVGPFMHMILFTTLSVILLGWWATTSIIHPLRVFEQTVQRFGENMAEHLIPETGPREIRAAAAALNRMQARIRTLVDDRMRVLAALSHDLRTPLTRLRLRTEFIADTTLQKATQNDIAQMQEMVDAALVYLRDDVEQPALTRVDLASVLQDICANFADMGRQAEYGGPDHIVIEGAFESLQRGFTNLVDNAVRYGTRAQVSITQQSGHVLVEIADDGPGIADESKMAVLEPFVRGNAARSMDETTGFGLGLPIAKAVIERHGGRLELLNRPTGGLVARVFLPLPTAPIVA